MLHMATPLKRKSSSQDKRSARSSPATSEPSSKPFLRFYHSESLRKKTLSVLDALEHAEDATAHRDDLANIVVASWN
jgi:hypothetical protein